MLLYVAYVSKFSIVTLDIPWKQLYTLKKMVLYSTKSGSLTRNHRGTTFGAV